MTQEYQCERAQHLRDRGYDVTFATRRRFGEMQVPLRRRAADPVQPPSMNSTDIVCATLSKQGVTIHVEFPSALLADWVGGSDITVTWTALTSEDIQPGTPGEGLRRTVHTRQPQACEQIRNMLRAHGMMPTTDMPRRISVDNQSVRGGALPRVTPQTARPGSHHQVAALSRRLHDTMDDGLREQLRSEQQLALERALMRNQEILDAQRQQEAQQLGSAMAGAFTERMDLLAGRSPVPIEMTAQGATIDHAAIAQAFAHEQSIMQAQERIARLQAMTSPPPIVIPISEIDERIIARAAHLLPRNPTNPTTDTTETFQPKRKVEID